MSDQVKLIIDFNKIDDNQETWIDISTAESKIVQNVPGLM